MSFAARAHGSSGGNFAPLGTMITQMESNFATGTTSTGTLTFGSNGTITFSDNYEDRVVILPSNWYTPTTTAIGAGYQIRFTLLSGSAVWNAGLVSGTLYALSSDRSLAWTLTYDSESNPRSASVLVEILTVTGEPYKSGTLSVEVHNGDA